MKYLKSCIALSILFAGQSFASIPFKGQVCEQYSNLNLPENASVLFSKDCETIFVKPPESGSIDFGTPLTVPTVQECELVNDRRSNITNMLKDLEQVVLENSRVEDGAFEQNRDLVKLQAKIKKKKIKEAKLAGKIKKVDREITVQQTSLQELNRELKECQARAGDDCWQSEIDIEDVSVELTYLEEEKSELLQDEFDTIVERETLEEILQIEVEYITSGSSTIAALQQKVLKKQQALDKAYERLVKTIGDNDGAKVNFTLNNDFISHVNKVKNANSDLASKIVALPIKKAVLSFVSVLSSDDVSFPIVKSSQIAGLRLKSEGEVAYGDELETTGQGIEQIMAGTALTGSVVVNQIGICASVENGNFNTNKLESAVTASLMYKFDEQVSRKFAVFKSTRYLHQIIKKQSKKSGLFSSKSLNSLTEKQEGEKYLQIDSSSIDSDFDWENREKLAKELRGEMMDEFVQQYGTGFFLKKEQVNLVAPGEPAAKEVSGALKQCPHMYCQYAAIGLDIMGSVLGGSTQEANMKKTLKDESRIELNDQKAIERFDTMGFKVKVSK